MKRVVSKAVMSAAAAVLVAGSITGCHSHDHGCHAEIPKLENKDFYSNGKIDTAKVKQAYYDMMERFNYPIPAVLKTNNFWTCDFNQKDILALGMGGIFWINEKGVYKESGNKNYKGKFANDQFGYLGHEIFCLPNQTLPEHRHMGDHEGRGPKMEAWHVRYGETLFFCETPFEGAKKISEMPVEDRPWGYGEDWFKAEYYAVRKAGELHKLVDPEAWHFLKAGKDGCIISEYATYHNHVEFSKPGLEFKNTGDK